MPSRAALIVSLIVSILMVIFALANTHTVEVSFVFYETPPSPVALLLIVTFAIGVLVGVLGSYRGRKKSGKRTQSRSGNVASPPLDPPAPRRGSSAKGLGNDDSAGGAAGGSASSGPEPNA